MSEQVLLTADEMRVTWMIVGKFREAQARLTMAQEMEAEHMTLLRAKYGLDESWVCNDLLDGFVKMEDAGKHDQNDT